METGVNSDEADSESSCKAREAKQESERSIM
jgi:hypothetical protein